MFSKVNAIVLMVKNFDDCVIFYRDTIGLKLKEQDKGYMSFHLEGQELCLIELSVASSMVTEKAIQPKKESVNRVMLATFVDETEKTYEELKAKGVKFIKVPTKQPWGQITANFVDPEGNIWEISHFVSA